MKFGEKKRGAATFTAAGQESWLARWGRLCARRSWLVFAVWAVVIVGSAVVYPHFAERQTAATFDVPGSDSDRAEEILAEEFPQFGDEQDVVVFRSEELTVGDPAYQREVAEVVDRLEGRTEVERVVAPTGRGGTGMADYLEGPKFW